MAQHKLNKAIEIMGEIIRSGALEENGGKAACIALIGETGVGKSTAIRDWCVANDYGHVTVWFNTMEDNGDVLGRTYDTEIDGHDHRVTMFATPEMFPIAGHCAPRGVLVLEEINSVPVHMIEQLKSLISERKIGGWHLPDGWVIVGTANPTSEDQNFNSSDYNTYDHDKAIKARIIEIAVKTELSDWMDYVYKSGEELNPDLGLFLIEKAKAGKDQNFFDPKIASPRQWSTLNAILNRMNGVPTETVMMLCDGVIKNEQFTQAFAAFFDQKGFIRPFSPGDILSDTKRCFEVYKNQNKEGNEPFVYYTWYNFALYIKNIGHNNSKTRKYRLNDKKLFETFQQFAKVTNRDILLAGLVIAMENVGYAQQFVDEDNEFFTELADKKSEIKNIINRQQK